MVKAACGFCQSALFLLIIYLTTATSNIGKLSPDVTTDQEYVEVGSLVTTSYAFTAEGWDYPEINNTDILRDNMDLIEQSSIPEYATTFDYISVFPEHTFVTLKVLNDRKLARMLAQTVPEPDTRSNPCIANSSNPDDQVVKWLSCFSRSRYIFIVAGILEKVPCTPGTKEQCREDGLKIYSTTVVFGKIGQVVAKYRKFHMVDEPALDAAATQEAVVFTTDANLTFGVLTGQDLLFHEPASTFLKKGLKHFVHNGAWKNTLPFRLATSVEHAWATTNKLFLVASGYMRAELGYTGTGHYFSSSSSSMAIQEGSGGWFAREIRKKGPVKTHSAEDISTSQNDQEPFGISIGSQDLSNWASVPVLPSAAATTIKVCHGKMFCCELNYKTLGSVQKQNYQLIAFDGNRTDSQNNVLYPEQTCGLVACSGASVLTCGADINDVIYTNRTYFTGNLTLSGSFSSDKVLPLTIGGKGDYFPHTTGLQFFIQEESKRFRATHIYNRGDLPKFRTFALMSSDFRVATSGVGAVNFTSLTTVILIALLQLSMS